MTDIAPAPNDLPQLYTTKKIAELFMVTGETVRNWINTGKLKGTKVSGKNQFRVERAELIRFAKSHFNLELPL